MWLPSAFAFHSPAVSLLSIYRPEVSGERGGCGELGSCTCIFGFQKELIWVNLELAIAAWVEFVILQFIRAN